MILTIKRKWLEKIRSGEKQEEYRALSPYYAARFKRFLGWEFLPASQAQVESALRAAGGVPFKDVILRAGYSLSEKDVWITARSSNCHLPKNWQRNYTSRLRKQ